MEWYAVAIGILVCCLASDALAAPVKATLTSCEVNDGHIWVGIYKYEDRLFLRLYPEGKGCPLEIMVQDDL